MKVNLASYLEELKGRLGPYAFKRRGKTTTLSKKSIPYSISGTQPSERQVEVRDRYRDKIETWENASVADIEAWNAAGKLLSISGFNYLLTVNEMRWKSYKPLPIANPQDAVNWLSYGEYLISEDITFINCSLAAWASEDATLYGFSLPSAPPADAGVTSLQGYVLSITPPSVDMVLMPCYLEGGDPSLYTNTDILLSAERTVILNLQGFYRNTHL